MYFVPVDVYVAGGVHIRMGMQVRVCMHKDVYTSLHVYVWEYLQVRIDVCTCLRVSPNWRVYIGLRVFVCV